MAVTFLLTDEVNPGLTLQVQPSPRHGVKREDILIGVLAQASAPDYVAVCDLQRGMYELRNDLVISDQSDFILGCWRSRLIEDMR